MDRRRSAAWSGTAPARSGGTRPATSVRVFTDLHRWEYDPDRYAYTCVAPPDSRPGGGGRCDGCGVVVTDEDLFRSQLPTDTPAFLHASLDVLAIRARSVASGPMDRRSAT